MKKLQVIAAGLGYGLLERNGMTEIAGLRFAPKASVFPAVTCVAQATLRTGLAPAEHGMISNGYWSETLRKPIFWEQSCRLVKGERVWSKNSGVFFFQQSLGEDVELIVSPAPIHKHGGGMIMSCYTKPTGMVDVLTKLCGKFPLWRYWGPLASPKVGRMCISYFEEMTNVHDVDEAYLYLPTLDYAAQKCGPDSPAAKAALKANTLSEGLYLPSAVLVTSTTSNSLPILLRYSTFTESFLPRASPALTSSVLAAGPSRNDAPTKFASEGRILIPPIPAVTGSASIRTKGNTSDSAPVGSANAAGEQTSSAAAMDIIVFLISSQWFFQVSLTCSRV